MFWILMGMLIFGGDSTNPERALLPDGKAFTKAIKDPGRLEQVIVLREEANALLKKQDEASRTDLDTLGQLSSQHDAGTNEFRAVFEKRDTDRLVMQTHLLNLRFRIKEQMTEKEWKKTYGKR